MPIANALRTKYSIHSNSASLPGHRSEATDETSRLLDFMSAGPLASRSAKFASIKSEGSSCNSSSYITRCDRGIALGASEPASRADGFTMCVDLQGAPAHSASSDECSFIAPSRHPGEVTIYDRRYRWRFDLPESIDCVLFHLPRQTFWRMVDNYSFEWSTTVPGMFSGGRADETLRYLAMATWLSLDSAEAVNLTFVDHLTASAMLHVAQCYAVTAAVAEARGGLGPWREARVRDLVGLHLHEPLPLATLARACGLSTSHFAREFKATFGYSPHHWLRLQRLERAKCLISTTSESLSDIAVASGFADQSHMTRIFSRQENVSPAAWRRNSGQRGVSPRATSANRSTRSVPTQITTPCSGAHGTLQQSSI
jgi:AraC family transcriptional regulator